MDLSEHNINKHHSRSNQELKLNNNQEEAKSRHSQYQEQQNYQQNQKWKGFKQYPSNYLIGNVDQFYLKRENTLFEEDIWKTFDQLEISKEKQEKVIEKVQDIEKENIEIKGNYAKLISLSKKQNTAMRQSTKLNKKLAIQLKERSKILKKLSQQLKDAKQSNIKLHQHLKDQKDQIKACQVFCQQNQFKFNKIEAIEQIGNQAAQTELVSFEKSFSESNYVFKVDASSQIQKKELTFETIGYFSLEKITQKCFNNLEQTANIQIQTDPILVAQTQIQTNEIQTQDISIGLNDVFEKNAEVQSDSLMNKLGIFQQQRIVIQSTEQIEAQAERKLKHSNQTSTSFDFEDQYIQSYPSLKTSVEAQTIKKRLLNIEKQDSTQSENCSRELSITSSNLRINLANQSKQTYKSGENTLPKVDEKEQKHQTQVTESEELLVPESNMMENFVSPLLMSYFKRLSAFNNDIMHDEEVMKQLEKKGEENDIFKGITRLLKEHKYLKLCLEKSLDTNHKIEEEHNEKTMELYLQALGSTDPLRKNKKQEQCTIY